MKEIPFRAIHMKMFLPEHYARQQIDETADIEEIHRVFEWTGTFRTLITGQGIIACYGVLKFSCHAGDACVVTSKLAKSYPISFHKAVKNHLDLMQQTKEVRDMYAWIHMEHDAGHRWAKKLGFEQTGDEMIKNHIRYVRTKNGK